MMIDKRARNPGDLVKYYSELIMEERRKIAESMARDCGICRSIAPGR
jgi:hypothetical protein